MQGVQTLDPLSIPDVRVVPFHGMIKTFPLPHNRTVVAPEAQEAMEFHIVNQRKILDSFEGEFL